MDTVIQVSGEYSLSRPELIWMQNVAPFPPRFPNGKSLHLTRKFHYHLPLKALPRTQNKRHNIEGIVSRQDCVEHIRLFIYSLSRHYKHLVRTECLPDLCWCMFFQKSALEVGPIFFSNYVIDSIWGYTCKQYFFVFFKSMWTLIPHSIPIIWCKMLDSLVLNSPTLFKSGEEEEGEEAGRVWTRQSPYCFCLMSCKVHPSEWKQVIYYYKKRLWQQSALLVTDSARVFNQQSGV